MLIFLMDFVADGLIGGRRMDDKVI